MPTLQSIQVIPLSQIRPMPNQPRQVLSQEAIDLMAESLKAIGQETSAKVRPLTPVERETSGEAQYELIGGHIRFAGAQKAGLTTLKCEVLDKTPEEAYLSAFVDNQSTDMYWLDKFLGIERLYKAVPEMTYRKLGDKLGISKDRVNHAMKVAEALTPAARQLLVASCDKLGPDKAISEYPIRALADLGDPQTVEQVLPVVLDRNLNQPQVKKLVEWVKAGNDPAGFEVVKSQPKQKTPSAQAASSNEPSVAPSSTHSAPKVVSKVEAVVPANTPGTMEKAGWNILAGLPVAAQIRAKIKKGERPTWGETFILTADLLWRGLLWTAKHLWKLIHWCTKEIWKMAKESAKSLLKALGSWVYKAARVTLACAFFAMIVWELYAVFIQHDAWKPVRTLSSWVFTNHKGSSSQGTSESTLGSVQPVPTGQTAIKTQHKKLAVAATPVPTVSAVQTTPTEVPKKNGDILSQTIQAAPDAAKAADGVKRLFGF